MGSVWRTFLATVVVALAFSLVFFTVLRVDAGQALAEKTADVAARASLAAQGMEMRLDAAARDALLASGAPAVVRLAQGDSDEARDDVVKLFEVFLESKTSVTEIAFLGTDGVARVRLQGEEPGSIVRVSDEENAAAAPYTDPALGYLERGDVHISHHGSDSTESSLVTLAAPVIDEQGRRGGFLTVRLDNDFVTEAISASVGDKLSSFIVAGDGGSIAALGAASAGDGAGIPSFAEEHPDAWAKFEGEARTVVADDGLYAFEITDPEKISVSLDGAPHLTASDHEHPQTWIIVAAVPSQQLPSPWLLDRAPILTVVYLAGLALVSAVTIILSRLLEGRRRLRRSVRESANRLAAIRDTLSEGLIVIDRQGRITDVNPESERLLGWSREEMLGRGSHELFHNHPDHSVPEEECPMRAVASSGVTFRSEDEVFERSDGSAIHVGASSAPLIVDGTVEGAVIVFRDITEIREYQEEIRRLAYRDELTGLPNRRVFADRLDLAIGSADRRSVPLAVMFLDLDGFKGVNDDYGHVVGDEFLRQIAARIRESVRASDTLARQGGDEFVVLLSEIEGREEAEAVARRIIEGLEEPFIIDGYTLRAATSIGIALRMDGECADTLIANADAAMYAAKDMGRNHYCVSGRAPAELG
jgi:diguanylate cyclase (GGDEF)-like protein/PAS domain S-box-containing protein